MSEWNDRIDEVDQLIAHDHCKQAVQEAGGLMEQLLRHLYAQVTSHINATEQSKLAAATDVATEAISRRFGAGAVDGKIQAHIVSVER